MFDVIKFKVHILTTTDIRKHSYLDHRYPVGLAFIPLHRAPVGGGGGKRLDYRTSSKMAFYSFLEVHGLPITHQKAIDTWTIDTFLFLNRNN